MKNNTWGGKRKGSGRPQKPPTKTLSYRVPEDKAAQIDAKIKVVIKQQLNKKAPA